MTRIINTYDQLVAAGGGIAICYRPRGAPITPAFQILRVVEGRIVSTDKQASWYDYGKKTFPIFQGSRAETLEKAKRWVAETFGEKGPWQRNAIHDYVPRDVAKKFPIQR